MYTIRTYIQYIVSNNKLHIQLNSIEIYTVKCNIKSNKAYAPHIHQDCNKIFCIFSEENPVMDEKPLINMHNVNNVIAMKQCVIKRPC